MTNEYLSDDFAEDLETFWRESGRNRDEFEITQSKENMIVTRGNFSKTYSLRSPTKWPGNFMLDVKDGVFG